jgi:protein involved in polysaccharide export with SLBB domain
LAIVGILGCAQEPPAPAGLQMSTAATASHPVREYLLQPGDQLDIKLFYNPELNETVVVRPDGKISLQLIDEVQAAGITPAQLDAALTKAYATEVRDPAVTVIVRTMTEPKIYVGGDVTRPGFVLLKNGAGVLQAVLEAGGFLPSADLEVVNVVRRGPRNEPIPREINMKAILAGTLSDLDYPLQPMDVVYVPKRTISRAANFMDDMRKILLINGFFLPL